MQDQKERTQDLQAQFLYEYQAQVTNLPPAPSQASIQNRVAMLLYGKRKAMVPRHSHPLSSWSKAAQIIQEQIGSGNVSGMDALLSTGSSVGNSGGAYTASAKI